jgi:hypothetical protein
LLAQPGAEQSPTSSTRGRILNLIVGTAEFLLMLGDGGEVGLSLQGGGVFGGLIASLGALGAIPLVSDVGVPAEPVAGRRQHQKQRRDTADDVRAERPTKRLEQPSHHSEKAFCVNDFRATKRAISEVVMERRTGVPRKGGDEQDALSPKARRILCAFKRAGTARAAKQSYNQRVRRSAHEEIMQELVDQAQELGLGY